MFHIILHEPEIPPNTGNIIRLCANTGATLHLIEPLGFDLSAREVRRAGLDYHDMARVHRHPSLSDCWEQLTARGVTRLYIVETGTAKPYSAASFEPGDALLFGSETRGLPQALIDSQLGAVQLSIPMVAGNRSLNLANAVSLVIYEAWRQQGFAGSSRQIDQSNSGRTGRSIRPRTT
jgi:tRNA (cytidine/uridine-2'-O-)-methyltransferase